MNAGKDGVQTWAIVTGACGGIGRELTERLASMGVCLLITGRSEASLDKLKADIERHAVTIKTCLVDFDSDHWKQDCDSILSSITEIEPDRLLFFSNAGYGLFEPYELTTMKSKASFIQCNIDQHVYLTEQLLESPLKEKLLYVCFTSSIAAIVPLPYFGLYHVSKSFVRSYAKALEAAEDASWKEKHASQPRKRPVRQYVESSESEHYTCFHSVMPYVVENTSFYDAPTVKNTTMRYFRMFLRLSCLNTTPARVVDAMLDPAKHNVLGLGGRIWESVYGLLKFMTHITTRRGLHKYATVFTKQSE